MPHSSLLLLSPLVSLGALLLIVLICRWVFSTPPRRGHQPPAVEDLGLLVAVARVRTREDAEMLREVLTDAGVRSGVSEAGTDVRVLVFQQDLELARQLVGAG